MQAGTRVVVRESDVVFDKDGRFLHRANARSRVPAGDEGRPTVDECTYMKTYCDQCQTPLRATLSESLVVLTCPSCGDQASLSCDTDPVKPEPQGGEPHSTFSFRPDLPETAIMDAPIAPPINDLHGTELGEYELIEELARGGMGVVYKARQRRLNRVVALKMILAGEFADTDAVQRFHAEAEAAARLDHPGIVPIYEVGEDDGRHFYSMGLVRGRSLQSRIAEESLDVREAAELMANVTDAVEYAHQRGIVHRDLKPSNVLLDEEGAPRITDFGLAKRLETDNELTMDGQVLGTPSYMPPEQAQGFANQVGPASDVFALGAMMYAATTGRPPFRAASLAETLKQVIEAEPVPPRRLNSAIDQDYETICLKCLQKSPASRYASAGELADDLRRFLAGEPIHARPIGRLERAGKWVRRNPRSAALVIVAAIAALMLVAFGVSLAYQSELAETNTQLVASREAVNRQNEKLQTSNAALEIARQQATVQRDAAQQARDMLARFRYAVDMQVASRFWQEGDVERLLTVLNRYADETEGLRGFEWHYLYAQTHHELQRWYGTGQFIHGGRHLVRAEGRQSVGIYDAQSMRPLRMMDGSELGDAVLSGYHIAVSGDERTLAVLGGDRQLRLWDIDTGRLKQTVAGPQFYGVHALNDDASLLLAACWDRTAKLLRVDSGEELLSWKCEATTAGAYPTEVAFSRDGEWFAVGWPVKNSIRIARTNLPRRFVEFALQPESVGVNQHCAVKFASDSKNLFTSCGSRCARLSLDAVATLLNVDSSPAKGDDGQSVSDSDTPENDKPVATLRSDDSQIKYLPVYGALAGVREDGRQLALVDQSRHSLLIWDVTKQVLIATKRGHLDNPFTASFQGLQSAIVSTAYSDTRLWNLNIDQAAQQVSTLNGCDCLAYSPDGKWLAGGHQNGMLLMRAAQRGYGQHVGTSVWQIRFSPDNRLVGVGLTDGTARLYRAEDGELQKKLVPPDWTAKGYVATSVAFNHDASQVVTTGYDNALYLWDVQSGKLVEQAKTPGNKYFTASFHPRTDKLVTLQLPIQNDGRGFQLGLAGAKPASTIRTGAMEYRFLGDSDVFIGRDGSNAVKVDAKTGQVLHTFTGHREHIHAMTINTDQTRLATLGQEGVVKIWDLVTGEETLSIAVGRDARRMAFHPSGEELAIGSYSGVRIISAPKLQKNGR